MRTTAMIISNKTPAATPTIEVGNDDAGATSGLAER